MFPTQSTSAVSVDQPATPQFAPPRALTFQLRRAVYLQVGIFVGLLGMYAYGLTNEVNKLHDLAGKGSATPTTALTASHDTTSTTAKK